MRQHMRLFWSVVTLVCLSGLAAPAFATPSSEPDLPDDYKSSPKHHELHKQPAPQAQPAPAPAPRVRKRFRTTRFRPIGVFRMMYFGNGDALPVTDSFGISAGLKVIQPFELEVGVSFFDFTFSTFANAGYSWEVFHARGRSGAGLEMRVAALGGYRYMRIDDHLGVDEAHAVTASGAVEFNLWLAPRFGLQLQFAGGVGVWVSRTDLSMPIVYPEFRTAFGFVF